MKDTELSRVISQFKAVYAKEVGNGRQELRLSQLLPADQAEYIRREGELHPSSFPFCGLRYAYELQHREEDPVIMQNFGSDYFLNAGTVFHSAVQNWIGRGGDIVGTWKCLACKYETKPRTWLPKCPKCESVHLEYQELGGKWGKHVSWHSDGVFKQPNKKLWVIDYKGLALTTRLPTPTGWTTMGEVKVGDQLLGSNGRPCTVKGKSSVHKRNCYRIKFDDGSSVVCDDEHLWVTTHGRSDGNPKTEVLNTEQIRATIGDTHRIKLTASLRLPKQNLVIEPYVLGCWLGDGHAGNGRVTKPDLELFENIEACGYETYQQPSNKKGDRCYQRNVVGLNVQLKDLGLRHNKHMPIAYLRGSEAQRLALLQGLMDSDGSYNELRKQAVFSTVNKAFATQVKELICSLGQRGVSIEITARGYGKVITAYHVRFRPVNGLQPFRLSRKANKVVVSGNDIGSRQRTVVSVKKVKAVDTQCIEVDSPDKTYLCTTWLIPTHNTTSNAAIMEHRKTKQLFPYTKNRFQIETYAPLIEESYGVKIAGWLLVMCARDNPSRPWNVEVVGGVIDEERRAVLKERLQQADKDWGIARRVVEKPIAVYKRLRETKICPDRDFYKDNIHNQYDPCPLSKVCFNKDKLTAFLAKE